MDNLKDELSNVVSRVRSFTLSVLEGEPNRLYDAARTYLASGGKKLRPFMVIKSCEMFSGMEEKALPAAAAVELIHNFSLIHDDIMDNEFRHGLYSTIILSTNSSYAAIFFFQSSPSSLLHGKR